MLGLVRADWLVILKWYSILHRSFTIFIQCNEWIYFGWLFFLLLFSFRLSKFYDKQIEMEIKCIYWRNCLFLFHFRSHLRHNYYYLRLHNECSYAYMLLGPMPDNCLTNKTNLIVVLVLMVLWITYFSYITQNSLESCEKMFH